MEAPTEECALCLSLGRETIEIFGVRGHQINIAEVLAKHFCFLVNELNGWTTRGICHDCWAKTEAFHSFYQSVSDVHERLAAEAIKFENYTNAAPALNPVLFVEPLEGYANDELLDKCEELEQEKPAKRAYRRKINSNETQIAGSNGLRGKSTLPVEIMISDGNETSETKSSDAEVKGPNELESRIPEYFDMACDLCDYKFETWSNAKEHYQLQHDLARGYLHCCNKKYFLRGRILDHVSWHINPSVFTCNVCSRPFKEKRVLTAHLLRHTDEISRKFGCDQCSKRFSRRHKLNRHMVVVHPIGDQKFICEFCEKSFKLDKTLKMHILKVHERAEERICDICAKIFKSKEGFHEHMLSHNETEEPRLQCTACGIWLKNKSTLQKHIKLHTEEPQICEICHKIKPTRSALRNHMLVVHAEASYQCTICEKKFKRQLTLTEHIASHTGENLYTCPYCPKMFKSNSNMHKHRKQSHLEQWTLDRQKKQLIYANQLPVKL